MKNFLLMTSCVVLLLSTGCRNFFDKEVFFDTDKHEPILTLAGVAQLDQNKFVGFASRTRALNDFSPYNVVVRDTYYYPISPTETEMYVYTRIKYDSVPGLKLYLRHNNETVMPVTDHEDGFYKKTLDNLTTAGGTLTLSATAPGYADAESVARIFEKPQNASLEFIKQTTDQWGATYDEYEVKIDDSPGKDFYLIRGEIFDSLTETWSQVIYTIDQNPIVEYTNLGYVVPDVSFADKSIKLKMKIGTFSQENSARFVSVAYLSEDMYKFLISLRNNQNTQNNPFAEPTSLLSQVTNGVGYFTVLNPKLFKLE
jgi:hypothetical protein